MLVTGGAAAVAFSLLGPWIFNLAFGEKMRDGAAYIVPLGIAFSILLVRSGSMLPIALARGFTLNPLLGNLVRLVSLPLAFAVAVNGGTIQDLIFVTIGTEVTSLSLTAILLKWKVKIEATKRLLPSYILGLALVIALSFPFLFDIRGDWLSGIQFAIWLTMAALCMELRQLLRDHAARKLRTYLVRPEKH